MIREVANGGVEEFLAGAGIAGPLTQTPVKAGGNNKVTRVDAGGTSYLLKQYFQHPDDPRDRLGAEYSFVSFAWDRGVRSVPKPLAADPQNRLGLYEFIQGEKIAPGAVENDAVSQAADFFCEVNRHRRESGAQDLPLASEACFSVADHLACVERRISRLSNTPGLETSAAAFVRDDLVPKWRDVKADGKNVLRPEERCLSPSDFGFHNAILEGNGRFRFIDFEYAGWDDPAKLICDFFCQPQVPVPLEHFRRFAIRAASVAEQATACVERAALLLPIYQIKWCCIMLNDFLPVGRERRSFAGQAADREDHRLRQLDKARRALERLDQLASL
jgi:hypothetical protein